MARRLLGTKPLPEPMLPNCQMDHNELNSVTWSVNLNSNIFIKENSFENIR